MEDVFVVLGYYAAYSGICLQTSRDRLDTTVPIKLPTDAVYKIPEKRIPHLYRGGSLKFLKKKCRTMFKKLSSTYKD